jgi:hypothetical protein
MIDSKEKARDLTYTSSKKDNKLYTLWVWEKDRITELYLPDGWFLRDLPDWVKLKGAEDFLILCKGANVDHFWLDMSSCNYDELGQILSSIMRLDYHICTHQNRFYNYIHAYKWQK